MLGLMRWAGVHGSYEKAHACNSGAASERLMPAGVDHQPANNRCKMKWNDTKVRPFSDRGLGERCRMLAGPAGRASEAGGIGTAGWRDGIRGSGPGGAAIWQPIGKRSQVKEDDGSTQNQIVAGIDLTPWSPFNDRMNNPDLYQIEDRLKNADHSRERPR